MHLIVRNILTLCFFIALPQVAGLIGSLFTISAIPLWYASLVKPSLNPPAWIFGPVWTLLYFFMGVSAFLIWQNGYAQKRIKSALGVFAVQLILNALWSVLFFGLHNPGMAFVEIIILWVSILATIIIFQGISKPAALLLMPYILWVSFATYLNYSIWILN